MKRLIIVLVSVICLLASVSCRAAPERDKDNDGIGVDRETSGTDEDWEYTEEDFMSEAEEESPVLITQAALGESWAAERMIIRRGNMSLAVADISTAIDQITVMAADLGGYVVNSRVWKERERLFGDISIRVPAGYFSEAMNMLRDLAVDVTFEQTSSQDVTEEYVDLSAKLQNLEATEEQLLKIMEKAETVEDILDVQRELSRTRGEIEQTKGRMQYLERTSSTSLIEVRLEQSELDIELRANKTSVDEGEKVRFYGEAFGGFPPYSYQWDFGDKNTSTEENPVHTYRSDGSYTVSLTVTDDRGNTDNETRTDYITVLPGWSAGSIASGAWNGLVTFGQVLADIFIWIGIFSPVWIVLGGVAYWWYRRQRKKGTGTEDLP
ncbi:MAG: DUF4349 domain-containing protein [Dehalococcoidales bacterium]|nr:MAG: DUF4349 domain-containing protein [Dehalococcoidales bacterium]